MLIRNYFIQQASSLPRLARETKDPEFAATLLAKAADLNENLDDLSNADVGSQAPGTDHPKW